MTITLDGQQLGNDKLTLTNAKDWAKGQKYSWVPSKLPLMTGLVKDNYHDLHGIYGGRGGLWRIMVLTRRARRRSRGRIRRILPTWGGWGRDGEERGKGAAGCGGMMMLISEGFLWVGGEGGNSVCGKSLIRTSRRNLTERIEEHSESNMLCVRFRESACCACIPRTIPFATAPSHHNPIKPSLKEQE